MATAAGKTSVTLATADLLDCRSFIPPILPPHEKAPPAGRQGEGERRTPHAIEGNVTASNDDNRGKCPNLTLGV